MYNEQTKTWDKSYLTKVRSAVRDFTGNKSDKNKAYYLNIALPDGKTPMWVGGYLDLVPSNIKMLIESDCDLILYLGEFLTPERFANRIKQPITKRDEWALSI